MAPNVAAPPAGKLAEAAGCVPDTAAAAVAAAAVAAAADKQPAATQAPKSEFDAAAAAASVSVKHRVKSHAGDDKPASGECVHAPLRSTVQWAAPSPRMPLLLQPLICPSGTHQAHDPHASRPHSTARPAPPGPGLAPCSAPPCLPSPAPPPFPGAGERLIKCFHAGVRWGITLPAEALKTRGDLATALNDAFAGEILSCGRGDTLSIAFLDAEGTSTEFPSLRSSGVKESASKWKGQVDKAVKIYVRRS